MEQSSLFGDGVDIDTEASASADAAAPTDARARAAARAAELRHGSITTPIATTCSMRPRSGRRL